MKARVDRNLIERMVSLRRELHQHPELSWQEKRTADKICASLDRLKIPNRRLLDTGIVADLPGPQGVLRVALRADIDALPITEETGLPFSSQDPGIMHACGHDGHTSMLLGAAELLVQQSRLPAPVRLIFQPAEEKGAGAKAMIKVGALEDVGMIFGGHLDRRFPAGTLVVTEGPVNAATDHFQIEITGRGGHAGHPHEAVDAVVVGSLMVMAIQTIVSREVNPAHPAVVSVGRFQSGTVANAIAGQAVLEGTIRTQEAQVRRHFKNSIRRIAESVGKLHGAEVTLRFRSGTPPLTNTPEMAELARKAARQVVRPSRIRKLTLANMGGEDFSYYLAKVPGCYIRFGGRIAGRESYPAHSSKFDFDEKALGCGAAWLSQVALTAGQALGAQRGRSSRC